MTYFIQNHPHEQYYFSEHVHNECEYVFHEKQEFLNTLFIDFLEFIKNNTEETLNMNNALNKFLNLNNTYEFKNKPVSSKYIKQTLRQVWKENSLRENELKIIVFSNLRLFNDNFKHQLYRYKKELYDKLTLIPQHHQKHEEILNKLIENNSHYEDNLIILDLYEYYTKHLIKFVFVTFDNNFYNALKKCDFDFIDTLKSHTNLNT